MKFFSRLVILGIAVTLTATGITFAQDTTKTFTISGSVGPGLGGVEMRGFPGSIVTDDNGYYIANVKPGWSGTITPTKSAYSFKPASITYRKIDRNRDNQDFLATRKTYTISGSAGIAGVVMNGLPGNPVTGSDGTYSVTVDFGWAGNVRPHKEGYSFAPPTKIYSAVDSVMTNQNYRAELLSYVISGTVGLGGVVMQGLPGEPVTDYSGRYSATVIYGWTGNVTPTKEGYTFKPESLPYSKVISNLDNQNYAASPILLEISGDINIHGGFDLAGVFLEGLPGAPITDMNGRYRAKVPYGWSGTVIPEKEGYEITPPSRTYTAVTDNMNDHDYFAERQMLTISEVIEMKGTTIPNVTVTANNGGSSAITDSKGRYTVKVPYGWSGEISLSKDGFEFNPATKSFTNVITNIKDGVPEPPIVRQPSGMYSTRSGRGRIGMTYQSTVGQTGGRRVLVIPAEDIKQEELAGTLEDMYVMSHILDERFKEPRMIQGVFRDFGDFFGRDNRQTEAIYMQDYGVVFMMEVDYTFTPAPQSQEQPEEQTKEADSTWQQTRERIFSGGGRRINRTGTGREYEGQMVDELKAELIRTLRHATNIRNLMPDEWVIFSVTGTGRQSGSMMMGGYGGSMMGGYGGSMSGTSGYGGAMGGGYTEMGGSGGGRMGGGMSGSGGMGVSGNSGVIYGRSGATRRRDGRGGMGGGMYGGMGGYSETGIPPATVLTIRAKKLDVDAFSKGEINFEQFRQKVQILMY